MIATATPELQRIRQEADQRASRKKACKKTLFAEDAQENQTDMEDLQRGRKGARKKRCKQATNQVISTTAAHGTRSGRPKQSRKADEVSANKKITNGEGREPSSKWPTATARRPPLPRKPTWLQSKEPAGKIETINHGPEL